VITLAPHFSDWMAVALVLCTGADRSLMATRTFILQRAGHTVIPAFSEPELIGACEEYKFHVAVIGQAISTGQKHRVFNLIRQHCPGVKVLELYSPVTGEVLAEADDWLAVPADVPQDLARRVSALAERPEARPEQNPRVG